MKLCFVFYELDNVQVTVLVYQKRTNKSLAGKHWDGFKNDLQPCHTPPALSDIGVAIYLPSEICASITTE